MKILIDEQLPTKLKYRFIERGFDVATVRDMQWLGIKNGDLLQQMELNSFNVLITNDKNMYYQQRIAGYAITLLNINTPTNRYAEVMNVIDTIQTKLLQIAEQRKSGSMSMYVVI